MPEALSLSPHTCWGCRVYGNSYESTLVAVVVPAKKALESWASDNSITGSLQELCDNPKVGRQGQQLGKEGSKVPAKAVQVPTLCMLVPLSIKANRRRGIT